MKQIVITFLILNLLAVNGGLAQGEKEALNEINAKEAKFEAILTKIREEKKTAEQKLQEKRAFENKLKALKKSLAKNEEKLKVARSRMLESKEKFDQANEAYTKEFADYQPLKDSIIGKKKRVEEVERIIEEKEELVDKVKSEIRKELKVYKKKTWKLKPLEKKMTSKKKVYLSQKEKFNKLKKESEKIRTEIATLKK